MFNNKLSYVLCRFLQLFIFSILPNLVHCMWTKFDIDYSSLHVITVHDIDYSSLHVITVQLQLHCSSGIVL